MNSRSNISRKNSTVFTCRYNTCRIFDALTYLPNTVNMEVLKILSCRDFLVLAKSLNHLPLSDIPNANDAITTSRVNHRLILAHQ
jgi:hypothetical protein